MNTTTTTTTTTTSTSTTPNTTTGTSTSTGTNHEIVITPSVGQSGREQLRQQCYDVRIDVFHREQGFPLDTEIDKLDEIAEHFLLRLLPSLQPIGTIRASRHSSGGVPYYKLSRLAVLKEYRKYHFGRELVFALHNWVTTDTQSRGEHSAKVVCHSQIPAKAFYAKFGYSPEGDEFDEDGAPHQKMVIHLPLSR
ncbi:acyl-CoA N-acyltransferase [Multifurca ochricompacta]|uniref:Acyl-CoA N-acyltransferase n=1 Tax=Multifurca ochricompacta TaxID=376703 RepID=A0AAD4MB07_9AGAM|nr:acyl-CoA N-acyltransferase [Multifurca ochricompacta]